MNPPKIRKMRLPIRFMSMTLECSHGVDAGPVLPHYDKLLQFTPVLPVTEMRN